MTPNCSECSGPMPPKKRGRQRVVCSSRCKRSRDVRMEAERWQAELSAANSRPVRTCADCKVERRVTPATWRFSRGVPIGALCIGCALHRARTEYLPTQRAKQNHVEPEVQRKIEAATRRAAKKIGRRHSHEGADAVHTGADVINAATDDVLAGLIAHLRTPDSPMHQRALAFLAERILPMKVVNDVAAKLARGDLGDEADAPQFVIEVLPTSGRDK